jgi:hypothetical protein
MVGIGYLIPGEGWFVAEAPEGATDEQVEDCILADIVKYVYLPPDGDAVEVRWKTSDGRDGRMLVCRLARVRG